MSFNINVLRNCSDTELLQYVDRDDPITNLLLDRLEHQTAVIAETQVESAAATGSLTMARERIEELEGGLEEAREEFEEFKTESVTTKDNLQQEIHELKALVEVAEVVDPCPVVDLEAPEGYSFL